MTRGEEIIKIDEVAVRVGCRILATKSDVLSKIVCGIIGV